MNVRRIALLFMISLTACESNRIIDKPIQFDDERVKLTLEYMKERYGLIKSEPTIDPKMIVIHYTVIPTMEKTFLAFDPPQLPASRSGISGASSLNVSSQFLSDHK